MKTVEDLIAIATAHGIELQYIAGAASNTKGVARRRKRTRMEVRLGLEVVETVDGRQTRSSRRPAWSIAELGQAAGGVPETPWNAAFYSLAGDRDLYWALWLPLANEAFRIARRERWAARVRGEDGRLMFYQPDLACLVLDEDAHQDIFARAPGLYACCLGVTQAVWDSALESKFRSVKGSYRRWLDIALGMIQRRMRTPSLDRAS